MVKNKSQALYVQIAHVIIMDIKGGKYQTGDSLPSIRSLSQKYTVTIKTIQKTIAYLDEYEIVTTKAGSGVFISATEETLNKYIIMKTNELTKQYIEAVTTLGVSKSDIAQYVKEGVKYES